MSHDEHSVKKKIVDLRLFYKGTQGGIFRQKTREKMVTKKGISKKGLRKDQFWYKQRENVKTTLLDLHLFIKEAGERSVNMVVTAKALRPVVVTLLHKGDVRVHGKMPDVNIAEIAHLFIQEGFRCLAEDNKYVTKSHARTIEEALDLSTFLVETFKPESERRITPRYVPTIQ